MRVMQYIGDVHLLPEEYLTAMILVVKKKIVRVAAQKKK